MPSKSHQKDDLGPRKIKEKVIKRRARKGKERKKTNKKNHRNRFIFSTFCVSCTKIFSHVTSHYISASISQGRVDDRS